VNQIGKVGLAQYVAPGRENPKLGVLNQRDRSYDFLHWGVTKILDSRSVLGLLAALAPAELRDLSE